MHAALRVGAHEPFHAHDGVMESSRGRGGVPPCGWTKMMLAWLGHGLGVDDLMPSYFSFGWSTATAELSTQSDVVVSIPCGYSVDRLETLRVVRQG